MRRIHRMPFGAEITEDGVRFSLWAPTARDVSLVLEGSNLPMQASGDGWRRLTVPEARAGSRYAYRVDCNITVPDPASRFQPDDVHGESLVVDPTAFEWSDGAWKGRPWEETVLYELHVGTATPEGTYAALIPKLEDLRDLGITAIELLPLAEFPGRRNWGYDGVLPYAPDAAYGTPDDLKRLIDRAHSLGLMIFIDVVYNHFGPSGNYLHAYAETFFTQRHQTPWGAGINFDDAQSQTVRDFFVHNALYWLEEYHADGLRFDAVHAILDDSEKHILAEIAGRIRAALQDREVHLVLENDANEARWLTRDGVAPRLHNAQWNDDLHHCWHTLLTGEADGYYIDYADKPVERLGRCLSEGFAYQGEASAHRNGECRGERSDHLPPTAFVTFLQNHDQIGNRAFGERISSLTSPEQLALARAALLLGPQIPMLYMGEEWNASTPFLYFVDFAEDESLSEAVREGRQREFANFNSFATNGSREIPDPTDENTFFRSKLAWDERTQRPYADVLAETRSLLDLRRAEILPLIKTPFLGARSSQPQEGVLDVLWRFGGGTLVFLANLGNAQAEMEFRPEAHILWKSPDAKLEGNRLDLPSWTGLFLKDHSR